MIGENLLNYYDADDEELCSSTQKACEPPVQDISIQDISKQTKEAEAFLKTLRTMKRNKAWCETCNKELKSFMHARTHYCSMRHLKILEEIKEKGLQEIFFPTAHSLQSICSKCGAIKCREDHLKSEEHEKHSELSNPDYKAQSISKEAPQQMKTYSILQPEMQGQNNTSRPDISAQVSDFFNRSFNIPHVCDAPKRPVTKTSSTPNLIAGSQAKTLLSETHHCSFCDVNYARDQFYDHLTRFPHSSMSALNVQYSPEIVNVVYSVRDGSAIECNLCNVTMRSFSDVRSHVKGIKHVRKFKSKLSEFSLENDKLKASLEGNVTATKPLDAIKDVCLEDKNSKNIIWQSNKERKGKNLEITRTNDFFCYLCKLSFNTKIELNVHTISFPHVAMSKWKSEVVSLGVPYAEYWVHSKTSLTCTLCNVDLFSVAASKSHVNGPNHKANLAEWCDEFASWKLGDVVDSKHFYCNSCELCLSGTSEAQNHYSTSEHLEKLKLYCKICQTPNDSEIMLLEHEMSQMHKENLFKEQPENNSMDAQIFQQVNKLVNNLYYANIVPQQIALDYLKQFNSEIEKLKKKYEEETVKSECDESSSDIEFETGFSLQTKNNKEFKLENLPTNHQQFEEEILIEEKSKQNDELTNKLQYIKQEIDNLRGLKQSYFFDMYLDVIKCKLKITKPSTERDILDEITKLIRIISTSTLIPLEKILELLQSLNMALDSV